MFRRLLFFCVSVCVSSLAAQQPITRTPSPLTADQQARAREYARVINGSGSRRGATPKDRASEALQRKLFKRMTEFTSAWNALVAASAKGIWDLKQAEAVHKAFDRVVHSEGWVEEADPPANTQASSPE